MLEKYSIPKEITTQTPVHKSEKNKTYTIRLRKSQSPSIPTQSKELQTEIQVIKTTPSKIPKHPLLKNDYQIFSEQPKTNSTRQKHPDNSQSTREVHYIFKKPSIMQNFRFVNNNQQIILNSCRTEDELAHFPTDLSIKQDFKTFSTYQDTAFQSTQCFSSQNQQVNNSQHSYIKNIQNSLASPLFKSPCSPKKVYNDFQKNFQTQANILQKLKTKEMKIQLKLGDKFQNSFKQYSENGKSQLNEQTVVRNSLFKLERLIENIHKRPDKLQYAQPAIIYNKFQRSQSQKNKNKKQQLRQKTPLTWIYMDVNQVPEEVNRKILTPRELMVLFSEETKKAPFRFQLYFSLNNQLYNFQQSTLKILQVHLYPYQHHKLNFQSISFSQFGKKNEDIETTNSEIKKEIESLI